VSDWSLDEDIEGSPLSNPPNIRLGEVVDAINASGGAGLVHIATHGDPVLGIDLEWYDPAHIAAVTNALNAYDAAGYEKDGATPDIMSYYDAGENKYAIALTPRGIANHIVNDSNALIYGDWSYSFDIKSSWDYGAFIGVTDSENLYCEAFDVVFERLACRWYTPVENTASAALDGDPSILYDNVNSMPCDLDYTVCNDFHVDPSGSNWRIVCEGCINVAARFEQFGAFDDKVWAVVDHFDTSTIRLFGFRSESDWPSNGVSLGDLNLAPGDGRHIYVKEGIATGRYALFAFKETDKRGVPFWSQPFSRSTRPERWSEITAINEVPAPIVAPRPSAGPSQEIQTNGQPSHKTGSDPEITTGAAHIGVYGHTDDANLVTTLADHLSLSLGYTVRTFTGNGSVVNQRFWAQTLRDDNVAWCAAHPGQCDTGPFSFSTTPIFVIVGELNPICENLPGGSLCDIAYPPKIEMGTFPDPLETCHAGTCIDPGSFANFSGSPLEDLPVCYVPAADWNNVNYLNHSADRYENASDPSNQHQRAIALVGDRVSNGVEFENQNALVPLISAVSWMPVYEYRASYYASGDRQGKHDAFVSVVNNGVNLLMGIGGITGSYIWPGEFVVSSLLNWSVDLTTQQSLVVLLPGCDIAHFTAPTKPPDLAHVNEIVEGMFSPDTGTTIVFGTAHADAGWDLHHRLWAEVLGETVGDAVPFTPWPRIIWEAKNRAAVQYPFLVDYLRSVISLGTVVRKQPPPLTSDAPTPDAPVVFGLRTLYTGKALPQFEIGLPNGDRAVLAVYDVRGRLVTVLQAASLPAGIHRVSWNGRDKTGQIAGSGVYFARLLTGSSGVATSKLVLLR
jgi:hypothetical protein